MQWSKRVHGFICFGISFFCYGTLYAQPSSSISPAPQVYLPGTLGTWHVIAYLPGRALPKDCTDAWVQNRLSSNQKEAQFESTFSCVRTSSGGTSKVKVQTNSLRVSKTIGEGMQWNEVPLEGRLEMDPGWPARWFVGWVDYWILEANPTELSSPNAYYVIGGPKKTVLAIYSRQPSMEEATYQQIIHRLEILGYQHLGEKILRLH